MSAAEIAIAVSLGLLVGTLSGLLGVGGGFIMVPGMVVLLGETQHVAQGTSLMVIIPTAIVGTITSARVRSMPWRLIASVGAGGTLGAGLGVYIALHVSDGTLRRIFGILLLFVAARMLFRPRRQPMGEEI